MAEAINPLILRRGNGEQLNRLLSYTLENEQSIVLHIQQIKNSDLAERLEFFTDGLKILARKVKTEEKFRNANEVVMLSWAVTKFAPVLIGLGFQIDGDRAHSLFAHLLKNYELMKIMSPTLRRYADIEPSLAHMDRETLLKNFDSQASVEPQRVL